MKQKLSKTNPFGVYFHWPFCLSKCPYCDFYSRPCKNADAQNELIDHYVEDLKTSYNLTSNKTVSSIFFGGGTPSLITPKNIEKLINTVYKLWNVAGDVEISLEANPNSNHQNMFSDLKSVGINRLSLGVQSLREANLKFLGRTHSLKDAQNAMKQVLEVFDNHNVDMMYGLPNQDINEWSTDVKKLCQMGFKHLSLYQLTIEENTPFAKKNVKPMDENCALYFYKKTESLLKNFGYKKYEVSNFAQKKYECRHNLLYWQGDDYVGIGKTAHGRIGLLATENAKQTEILTNEERATELLFMGLRLVEGINKQKFKEVCNLDIKQFINEENLEMLKAQKLMSETQKFLKATAKGGVLLNQMVPLLLKK